MALEAPPSVPGLLETFPCSPYLRLPLPRTSVPFPLQARGFVSVGRTLAIFPPHPLDGHVVSQWHKVIKRESEMWLPSSEGETLHWTLVGQVGSSSLPVCVRDLGSGCMTPLTWNLHPILSFANAENLGLLAECPRRLRACKKGVNYRPSPVWGG